MPLVGPAINPKKRLAIDSVAGQREIMKNIFIYRNLRCPSLLFVVSQHSLCLSSLIILPIIPVHHFQES